MSTMATQTTIECVPNFFLLGAAKSGTTSAANYIDQHPDAFICKPKEPNYFAFETDSKPACIGPCDPELLHELLLKYSVTSSKAYTNLFVQSAFAKAKGDASVRYLYESHVPQRLAEQIPNAKLIVLLRDPVDRLYSHYHMNVRMHIEPESLVDALAAEDERVQQGWGWDWHYRRVGEYSLQIERYLQYFDRSQLLILFHADLQKRPLETMQQIFRHLEISPLFKPDFSKRSMVGHTPKWKTLRRVIRDENALKTLAKAVVPRAIRKSFVQWSESKNRQSIPKLDNSLRENLNRSFSDERERLADVIGKTLPW